MKLKLFLFSSLTSLALSSCIFANDNVQTINEHAAKCSGSSNCKACKNCKYCKHCSKNGGSCGVCN